jgi:polar amino acid transport system substrate-binding protein
MFTYKIRGGNNMNNKLKQIIAVSTIAIMTLGFTACGKVSSSSNAAAETKVDKIKKAGKIVLGTSADYPPYEYHKSIDGKDTIVGFDINIANQIAKDLGVTVEVKDMDFKSLLGALQAGDVDLILAGMNPTPERAQSVDFSKVYYVAVQKIIVRAEDKDKIKTVDDLKGMKIGVQKGSTQEGIAKDQLPNSQAVALSKISDLVLALKSKNIDAAMIEEPVAVSYVNANSDLAISDVNIKAEDSGSAVAIKKDEKDFMDSINKTLDRIKSDKTLDKYVTDATNGVN